MGKFGRPQGIKGLVRVNSFCTPPEQILAYPAWFFKPKGAANWQMLKCLNVQVTPQCLLAQVAGYTTRESVAELTNLEIAVPTTALPKLLNGEYYWSDLIGMRVLHHTGVFMGFVDTLFETGANDVLVVIDDTRENKDGSRHPKKRLIPYLLDDVIQKIDKKNREIIVYWDLDF